MFEKLCSMKKRIGMLFTLSLVSLMAVSAFADESGAGAAMKTSFEGVKTEFVSAITLVAPVAIAIIAAPMIWKLGVRFFKSLTSHA